MPSRRRVLKKLGAGTTALLGYGCIIAREGGSPKPPEDRDRPCWLNIDDERIDAEPFFSPEDEEEMVLPQGEVSRFGYESIEDENHPDFDAYIYTRDYSHTVLMKVDVYPTVDEAVQHYEDVKSGFQEPESFGVGDEAVEQESDDEEFAEMVFRKSNAVGHVKSYVPEEAAEDEEERSRYPRGGVSGFARRLRDYWGGTSDYDDDPGFCRDEVIELQQPEEDG